MTDIIGAADKAAASVRARGPSFSHVVLAIVLQIVFGMLSALVFRGNALPGLALVQGCAYGFFWMREMGQIGDLHWPRFLSGLPPLAEDAAPTLAERMRAYRQAAWPAAAATVLPVLYAWFWGA